MRQTSLRALLGTALVLALAGVTVTAMGTTAGASGPAPSKFQNGSPGTIRPVPGITNGPILQYSIQSDSFSAPPGTQASGSASCPTGTVLLGGGVEISNQNDPVVATINSSSPLGGTSTTAWQGYVNNNLSIAFMFTVYAECATAPKGYSIVSSASIDNPAGTQTADVLATCPTGAKVLGGGGVNESSDTNVSLSSSLPLKFKVGRVTHYAWRIDAGNASSGDNHAVSYAICGKKITGYKLAESAPFSQPSFTLAYFGFAPCPVVAGLQTIETGGGVSSSSSSPLTSIVSTLPNVLGGSQGWLEAYLNDSSASTTTTTYAVCALLGTGATAMQARGWTRHHIDGTVSKIPAS